MTTPTATTPPPAAAPSSPDGTATGTGHPRALPPATSMRHRTRGRARDLVTGALGGPRFVSQRPPALLEHITYARSGEWTTEHDGPRRSAAVAYAWMVAIPLATIGYLLAWTSARPGRFATTLVITGVAAATLAAATRLLVGWPQ